MPCIFCLAVFALFVGAITTAVLDHMQSRLDAVAMAPVTRAVDSESVTRFDAVVACPQVPGRDSGRAGRPIPVSVTVYKKHKRVRIQVMTHDLSRDEAEAIENMLADALELRIVDRSDAHDEEQVRAAFGHEAAQAETSRQSGQSQSAQTQSAQAQTARTAGPSPQRRQP